MVGKLHKSCLQITLNGLNTMKDLSKVIMKKMVKDNFLWLIFNILKIKNLHNDLQVLPKRMRIQKTKSK